MRRWVYFTVFAIFPWCIAAHAQHAQVAPVESRGAVAFFASERIMGDWIESYFRSVPRGGAAYNECEAALGLALTARGYRGAGASFTGEQRAAAKRLNTVFKRYNDVSTIPNDTAARAAAVVDSSASVVLACRAVVDKPGWRMRHAADSCASARCKAVDTATRRRIATASGTRCGQSGAGNAGGLAAMREVCSDMAAQLCDRLAAR